MAPRGVCSKKHNYHNRFEPRHVVPAMPSMHMTHNKHQLEQLCFLELPSL